MKTDPYDRSVDKRINAALRSEESLRLKLAVERLMDSACPAPTPAPGLTVGVCDDPECPCAIDYKDGGAGIETFWIGERRGYLDEALMATYVLRDNDGCIIY
jgi:hypothetical protein